MPKAKNAKKIGNLFWARRCWLALSLFFFKKKINKNMAIVFLFILHFL
jgi:hypothetical protein